MGDRADSETRQTLLCRLRQNPANQDTWGEFVEHYGRRIYAWCRKWRLQDADAEDVTQIVLLKLSEKMKQFEYDPNRSFRGWLKTLTHHAWHDFVESRARTGQGSGDTGVQELLSGTAGRDDLVAQLEEQFDRELYEEACLRVRLRVAPQTWEAFRLTALEDLSGAEVSERIGMQVAQVYVAKRRVQKMLKAEIEKLDRG